MYILYWQTVTITGRPNDEIKFFDDSFEIIEDINVVKAKYKDLKDELNFKLGTKLYTAGYAPIMESTDFPHLHNMFKNDN